MKKISLFEYCHINSITCSKSSKASQLLENGCNTEVELAKALTKTKAFKENATLRELCASVIKEAGAPKKEAKVTPRDNSCTKFGENER